MASSTFGRKFGAGDGKSDGKDGGFTRQGQTNNSEAAASGSAGNNTAGTESGPSAGSAGSRDRPAVAAMFRSGVPVGEGATTAAAVQPGRVAGLLASYLEQLSSSRISRTAGGAGADSADLYSAAVGDAASDIDAAKKDSSSSSSSGGADAEAAAAPGRSTADNDDDGAPAEDGLSYLSTGPLLQQQSAAGSK